MRNEADGRNRPTERRGCFLRAASTVVSAVALLAAVSCGVRPADAPNGSAPPAAPSDDTVSPQRRELAEADVARALVLVEAKSTGDAGARYGNGVIVRRGPDAEPEVLTCAHVVERKGAESPAIAVHLFPRNLTRPLEWESLELADVRIVRRDLERDLVLLSVALPAGVGAVGIESFDEERLWGQLTVYSVTAGGGYVTMQAFHPMLQPGQSGSPALVGGTIVGVAQAHGGRHGTERFVSAARILEFLRRDDSAKEEPNE